MKELRQHFDFGGYSVRAPRHERARFAGHLWTRCPGRAEEIGNAIDAGP
jgi:hypothetical protein